MSKRVFQLAEDRGQLDWHPLRKLKPPKVPKQKIHVYTDQECHGLCRFARQSDHFKTVLPSKMLEATAMAKPTILGVGGYAAQFLREADAGICIEPENAN